MQVVGMEDDKLLHFLPAGSGYGQEYAEYEWDMFHRCEWKWLFHPMKSKENSADLYCACVIFHIFSDTIDELLMEEQIWLRRNTMMC